MAQPEVDAGRAIYTRINSIKAYNDNDVDSLYVASTAGFNVKDTVLIYQTIGAEPNNPEDGGAGQVQNLLNTGKYTIVKILEIIPAMDLIVINTKLPQFKEYHIGEVGQLVKVSSYEKARLTSSFNFPPWDSVNKTGGVFPIIVSKKLILEADFSADGKGFLGANPDGQYSGSCSVVDTAGYHKPFFTISASDSAALKGEGLVKANYPWVRGNGLLANGGGGGNGMFSGGGGGANRGQGGKGGNESEICSVADETGGNGGTLDPSFFSNLTGNFYYNRIYMGGGGGTATQDPANSLYASAGGNGGGIIIIIADTIVGNNLMISANGHSVDAVASAGAGGGGAGGSIILEVTNYIGPLRIETRGGKGGDSEGLPYKTGPGGGGGGGAIWHNGPSFPVGITTSSAAGMRGSSNYSIHGSSSGSLGEVIPNLQIPINGFLLNFMPDHQDVCEGVIPDPISASKARGGTGTYTYKWEQSVDAISWAEAVGLNTNLSYQPPALTDTTYFRRIVNDGILPQDTSFYVRINVHPVIENNIFLSDDTVCYNDTPGTFTPLFSISGGLGAGSYSYIWEQSPDSLDWLAALNNNDLLEYSVPSLYETTYFHRIVKSGACTDTSNLISIDVLPQIINNLISSAQEICNNSTPEGLTGPVPDGGIQADKRYLWQVNTGSSWSDLLQTQNYGPSALLAGNYDYRRIFLSGDECIDTSNIIRVISWPDITGNAMLSGDSIICAQLPSISINASIPQNGSGIYKYVWQTGNSDAGPWTDSDPVMSNLPHSPGTLNEDKWFRRAVFSGAGDVCSDLSPSIKISVLPVISSNTISAPQLVCEGSVPDDLTGTSPAGGDGNYIYQWLMRSEGTEDFEHVPANGNNDFYNVPALVNTFEYKRLVFSGLLNTCKDSSNLVQISILPEIANNIIEGSSSREICLEESLTLDAPEASGGDGSYEYIWEISDDGLAWADAPGVHTNNYYTSESFIAPKYFRRNAVSSVCSDISDMVFVDTLSLPILTNLTVNLDSICHLENSFYLRQEILNAVELYSISFTNGVDGDVFSADNLHSLDSVNINSFPQERHSYEYKLQSITDSKGCKASYENLASFSSYLELFPDAEPQILLDDVLEICSNQLDISADPDIAVNFWWTIDNEEINISDLSGLSTVAEVDDGFDSVSGWLKFYASSPGCENISGYTPSVDSIQLYFYEQPEEFIIPLESDVIFLVDQYWVNHSTPTSGQLVWTVAEGGAVSETVNSDSSLFTSIPKNALNVFRGTIINGNCEPRVDEIIIQRNDVHIYQGFSPANQDGINDFLVAEGLDSEDVEFTFQVFSVSGMLIREITNETAIELGFRKGLRNNGMELWDGKVSDEQSYASPGLYYYVLNLNYKDLKINLKEFVVIKE